ncbi:MAG: hypothetical protein GX606_01905 [Elusimicrobia bacterium]|nr:hypothetical protein [Elusimicrobiota bacterium]
MPEQVCPHCKKPIYDEEALLCHFCGNSLGRSSSGVLGKMSGAGMKWLWITIATIIVLSFIISMF